MLWATQLGFSKPVAELREFSHVPKECSAARLSQSLGKLVGVMTPSSKSQNSHTCRNCSLNPEWAIFNYYTLFGCESHLAAGEQEQIRMRLASSNLGGTIDIAVSEQHSFNVAELIE